jgi:carboxymethylenebutenolidase
MCRDSDGLRALPREAGGAVAVEAITLGAADGAAFSAVSACRATSVRSGVVVLPDNRGLGAFYAEIAIKIAELGYSALAIDYYGRTAGTADRVSDFPFMEHLMKVTRPGLEADFAAAVEFLRSAEGGGCRSILALGFCFGGRQAYLAATLGHGLTGVIGFYGFPGTIMGSPGPTERAADIASPVLAIWAGADNIGIDQIEAFTQALTDHGVAHESVVYPEAPHSFFDIKHAEWADASADAWNRVRIFLDKHSN